MTAEALVQQTDLHPIDRDGVVGNELVPVSVEPLSVHASLVQVSPLPSIGPDAEPRFYEMILIAILTGLCEPALDAITYPLCSQRTPPTALLCTSKSLRFAMRIGVRTLFLADMPRHFLPQFGQLENVTFAAFNPGLLDTLVATASDSLTRLCVIDCRPCSYYVLQRRGSFWSESKPERDAMGIEADLRFCCLQTHRDPTASTPHLLLTNVNLSRCIYHLCWF